MAKKKDDFEELFWTMVFAFGGLWLLDKILEQPVGTPSYVGIGGVNQRQLRGYIDDKGNQLFRIDLAAFTTVEITTIIEGINFVKTIPQLGHPHYKQFSGELFSGEIIIKDFRILVYRDGNNDLLMLTVFRKTTNETPTAEKTKATNRLREYLARKK